MNLIVRLYSPPIRQQPAASSSSSSSILLSLHAYMAAGIITIQHMLIYRLCRPLCIIIESTKYCITCSAWAGSGRVSACLALATVVAILTSLVLAIRYLLLLLQGECMWPCGLSSLLVGRLKSPRGCVAGHDLQQKHHLKDLSGFVVSYPLVIYRK